MEKDSLIVNLPDWKKKPRHHVTTETINKHVGNYVTVLGQIKSLDDDIMMINDGTGTIQVKCGFVEDDMTVGAYVLLQGKATSPSEIISEDISVVPGEEGTLELRAKTCKMLDQHSELFYAN